MSVGRMCRSALAAAACSVMLLAASSIPASAYTYYLYTPPGPSSFAGSYACSAMFKGFPVSIMLTLDFTMGGIMVNGSQQMDSGPPSLAPYSPISGEANLSVSADGSGTISFNLSNPVGFLPSTLNFTVTRGSLRNRNGQEFDLAQSFSIGGVVTPSVQTDFISGVVSGDCEKQ